MNFRQSFRIALQAIWRKKTRSVLTMLGIIIGVAAVVIMVTIVQGSNEASRQYYESMGTNKITVYASLWGDQDVTDELYDYCLSLGELVIGVTPNATFNSDTGIRYRANSTDSMENARPAVYLGSEQYSLCNHFTVAKGRDLSYLDIKQQNQVVVLGSRVADYLFPYTDPVGEHVTIGGYSFEVIGVYAEKDPHSEWSMDSMAVVPYTLCRLLNRSKTLNEFTVKAASQAATNEVITRLNLFLSGKIDENTGYFYVYSENQWQQEDEKHNQMLSLVVGGIAGISLLVGGIGIMNIMLVTVTERTREIGIRMAIGASRLSIITQFLIEAALICCIGGIIGVLLSVFGTLIAGKLLMDMVLLPKVMITAGALGFSVLLGVGFGMYPAIKASGLQPVEALRVN